MMEYNHNHNNSNNTKLKKKKTRPLPQRRRRHTTAIILAGVVLLLLLLSCCITRGNSSFFLPALAPPAAAAAAAAFRNQPQPPEKNSAFVLWSTKNGKTQPQPQPQRVVTSASTSTSTSTSFKLAPLQPISGVVKKKKNKTTQADQSEAPVVKRRRPRKISTTTTKTKTPPLAVNLISKQPETPKTHYKARSFHDYTRYQMLDHELLTTDEEQILGNKVKRAIELRKQIQAMVKLRRGEPEGKISGDHVHDHDDDIDIDHIGEGDDDSDDNERDDADLFPQNNRRNTYFQDNFQDDAMAELSVYKYGKGKHTLMEFDQDSLSTIATSAYTDGDYMDYELLLDDDDDDDDDASSSGESSDSKKPFPFDAKQTAQAQASSQSILDDRLLTDEDIVQILKVEGGRAELYHIFMEGALARDKMIRSNVRLVVSIAKKWAMQSTRGLAKSNDYRRQSIYKGSWDRPSLDEVTQEGLIGLSVAADRFEPDRKLKFATYATWWITSYIRECFHTASTGCLRVPTNFHSIKHKYQKIVKRTYENEGAVPPFAEIAEEMNLTVKRLRFVLDSTRTLLSIDAPLAKGAIPGRAGSSGTAESNSAESALLKNSLACHEPQPEDHVEFSFLRQCLENAMAAELSPHERDVLRLRLGLDDGVSRSAREVAKYFGGTLSTSDVRNAEMKAFRKLRSPYTVQTYQLLGYLDFVGIDLETAGTERYASSPREDLRGQIGRTNQRRSSRNS